MGTVSLKYVGYKRKKPYGGLKTMNTLKKLLVLSLTFGTLPMVFAEQQAPATEPAASVEAVAPVATAPVAEPVAPVEASAPVAEEKTDATEATEQPSEEELNKFLEDLQKQM